MKHYVKHSFGTGIEKFLKIFLLLVQKHETAINHSPTLLSRGKHPLWGLFWLSTDRTVLREFNTFTLCYD